MATRHSHVTGQFMSALCENCNLQYKLKIRKIGKNDVQYLELVIFHNLKGHDSHHIFKNLRRFYAPKDIRTRLQHLRWSQQPEMLLDHSVI